MARPFLELDNVAEDLIPLFGLVVMLGDAFVVLAAALNIFIRGRTRKGHLMRLSHDAPISQVSLLLLIGGSATDKLSKFILEQIRRVAYTKVM